MSCYIVEGGKKLEGIVNISGSKNASLPIIAGSILSGKISRLYNVPNIQDTKITLEIIKLLGGNVKKKGNKIEIDTKLLNKTQMPMELMNKMRSTVIMAGAIVGRFKEAIFSYPGGCEIGARPIDLHLKSFKKLGINIEENTGFIRCKCDKIMGTDIHLDFPSVGVTENIILATVLSEGITTIFNAAKEPEIVDLALFLNKMGAKIKGAGTDTIIITGTKNLNDVGYKIMPDRIEAGTFLCIAASNPGRIQINNCISEHIETVISKLEECGCEIEKENNSLKVLKPKRLKAIDIKTMPYPGFPTDMQSILSSILTTSKGTSIIVENIFESRYKSLMELKKMGAKVTIEGKTAIIKGVKRLHAANVTSFDLRGGAALVVASLNAKGKTRIENIEYIFRGYEKIEEKLQNLGAKIYIE